MAAVTTPTESQLAKKVYGDNYERLPFNATLVSDKAPFSDKYKVGDTFKWAAEVTMEQGATYNGSGGGEGTLAAAIVGQNKQTDVAAFEMHMRTRITTRAFEEAMKAGETAFENATKGRMTALQTAMEFRREDSFLYGQEGLFVVSSVASQVITITDASWSATRAIRMVGAVLEAFDATTATANQLNGDIVVTGVDLEAKTLTVTGTISSVVATNILYYKGARTTTAFNEMAGLHKLMTTTTGTLQGIDVGLYPWFKPNVASSFGRPTMLLILKAMRKLVGRNTIAAKKDETQNTTLWVPSVSYEILNSDLMTSRRFDGSYSRNKGTTGVQGIEYYGQTGITELTVHPMLRDGDALAVGPENLFRVGTSDVKWDTGPNGEMSLWNPVTDKTSYEVRAHFIQQIALRVPGRTVAITGITE